MLLYAKLGGSSPSLPTNKKMKKMKPRITFTENATPFILEAFGKSIEIAKI